MLCGIALSADKRLIVLVSFEATTRRFPSVQRKMATVTLSWYPVFADVSHGGDLGYTTRSYIFTDRSAQAKLPHSELGKTCWTL
jgi:hypothetical protein